MNPTSPAGPANVTAKVPTWADRLSMRRRPDRAPVMYQHWHDLLFLHWRWSAADIQRTLPDGLTVDTHDGHAWLGVVPFCMTGVRPRGLPAVPGLSNFIELNLRTYVHSADGTPGVWFYSLDCNQRLAVALARSLFALPYVFADMTKTGRLGRPGGVTRYRSQRPRQPRVDDFVYDGAGPTAPAPPESLAWWLVERYVLFAGGRDGRPLRSGRVWHEPYEVGPVKLGPWSTTLFEANGFRPPGREPDHTMASAGVSVKIYPLKRGGQLA